MLPIQNRSKMHTRLILCAIFTVFSVQFVSAQEKVRGRVVSDSSGTQQGIAGIEIFVPSTSELTITDRQGYFVFTAPTQTYTKLIARFSPFDSAEFAYNPPEIIFPLLVKDIHEIEEIIIKAEKHASTISGRGIQKVEILNEGEFKKAACCTLSESFETSNTIEVSNADGVSGIRQVEMLGLAGKYVHMSRDNIPTIRGLSVLTGLAQIPGPMVSGVHISKGTGSVSNGYEGISGGLNYALKSENNDPQLFVNGYLNHMLRTEGNIVAKQKLSKNAYNHLYLHYGTQLKTMDYGKDGIADIPLFNRVYVGDQFKFQTKKLEGQLGVNYTSEKRKGGNMHALEHPNSSNNLFRFEMNEEKVEAFAKIGIFLNEDGSKSFGNILNVSSQKSDAILNNLTGRSYKGNQNSLSYSGIFGTPDHNTWSTRSGINVQYDDVDEHFTDRDTQNMHFSRQELSLGVFSELVYKKNENIIVLGLRADHNNLYGYYLTPRLHIKHEISETKQLHFQAGTGRRTPWVFAENLPLLISNRKLIIQPQNSKMAYGIAQEQAINVGGSYTQQFMAFGFPSTFSADGHFTYFTNQTLTDRDASPEELLIFGSANGSKVGTAQADWMFKLHRRVELKFSYRYIYAVMKTGGIWQIQNMQSPHRGLVTLNAENRKKWKFDAIVQINSPKRLPDMQKLAENLRLPAYSPWYVIFNAQIRKEFKNLDVYLGGENLANFFQKNPVLGANDPTLSYFDAAYAYGPTIGTMGYIGFSWKLK